MTTGTNFSTTRVIDGVYLAVNVAASSYTPDDKTIKLAEQAAAVEKFYNALPGEPAPEFGGPLPGLAGNAAAVATPEPVAAETSGYPDEQASQAQLAAAGVIGHD